MSNRPSLLIESWLPFDAVGAESLRERGYGTPFPGPVRLHVWWARRPLTVSRAAVLASLLPAWDDLSSSPHPPSPPLAGEGKGAGGRGEVQFPTEAAYRAWFLRLLGIYGDPVAARKLLEWGRQQGKFIPNPYTHERAFTVNPTPEDLALLEALLAQTWGDGQPVGAGLAPAPGQPQGLPLRDIVVLDPFAGGGSIPFEARRYGLSAIANELNPVAAVILKATLDYPARFGADLAADIRKWGRRWYELVKPRLQPFFTPLPAHAEGAAYLWARTVACPVTGKPVPLSPNWWLSKDPPVAVRLLTDPLWDAPRFEIVHLTPTPTAEDDASSPGRGEGGGRGEGERFDPDVGTISRGVARSPWTGDAIDGDYIKAEAQAGRMGQMLYAVAVKRRGGFDFRAPTEEDLAAAAAAEAELARLRPRWEAADVIPTEPIPEGLKTAEPMRYGMFTWADMFSPRQLLALGTFVETLRELRAELRAALDAERAAAVETYLAMAISKAINYNSYLASWNAPRCVMRSVFDRHDFSFKWTFGEFDAAGNLLPWSVDQVYDAYRDLTTLLAPPQPTLKPAAQDLSCAAAAQNAQDKSCAAETVTILQGNAADLSAIPTGSVHAIVTDPPYYDNVMYAELADFFYVWLKRTAGHLYPQWFAAQLTDKDGEAVANPARFKDLTSSPSSSGRGGRGVKVRASDLAEQDYERKMAAAFREMHRVLRDDGVLTVMFTHKRVEAWDTLASALIGAGFTVESSWPVHTESEHSLHQANKNAAQSTILLACRKRTSPLPPAADAGGRGEVWWDDVAPEVRRVARQKAEEFAAQGISGVDLYLSVFGPVLAVISRQWPVLTREVDERTGAPKPLRPETALDLARQEVIALRKRGLLLGRRLPSSASGEGPGVGVEFDPLTDWYLMAWDAFHAAEFPADEARKLAIALGLEIEQDLVARRVISKKGSDVMLLEPKQRRAHGRVDPEAGKGKPGERPFETWLDAVHTAMLVYEEDGAQACEAFLKRTGLLNDSTFKACLQAMINAIPRARVKGKFVRPEAEALEGLRLAFFEELTAPAEEEPAAKPEQLRLM